MGKLKDMKPIYLFFMLSLAACGARESKEEASYAKSIEPPTNSVATEESMEDIRTDDANINTSPALPDVVVPKLIRTADLRFQVKNLDKSSDVIDQLTKEFGAYISSANMSTANAEANNTLMIRVPNGNFDGLLKAVCKESIYMQRKNVSTQDVTEEYVDIEARLKTKKEVEARYIEILKNKAKTVEDVLKAEEQIRLIREEIEAREGRLNYLKNQVSYSTISVQLYEQIEYHEDPIEVTNSFGNKASSGFDQGWTVIQNIVIGLITIWPLLLIGVIVFIIIRKKMRKNKVSPLK